jgi:hypothetical protein
MFDRHFPCRYRPLPSHAPQDLLSRLFAARPTIRRGYHPLRHMSPSIRCHGVGYKTGGGLVFLRIFNTFVLFNVGDSPFIALESFDHSCF